MKTIQYILFFGLLPLFFSCGKPNEKEKVDVITLDSSQTNIDKNEKERLEKRKEIEEQEDKDSLRLQIVLQNALKIASKNFSKDCFSKKYEVSIDSIHTSVEINLNCHFTKSSPH